MSRRRNRRARRAKGHFPPARASIRPQPRPAPAPQVSLEELIRRDWEKGPNAGAIHKAAAELCSMSPAEVQLFRMAVALEEGDLPWIEQYGFARFGEPAGDHRIITLPSGEDHAPLTAPQPSAEPRPGTASMGAGPAAGRAAAAPQETAAGPAPRRGRAYRHVADVVEEDAVPLARHFPQFSVPIWDPKLRWWHREGWLQPLHWWPVRVGVRLCYEPHPHALPIIRINPDPHPHAPHVWLYTREKLSFRGLCYTFAPDRTLVRGRSDDDNAAEALRQAVVWLCRYFAWQRFEFWPGEDVSHDPETIERLTRSGDPCPAHPHERYGSCCRPRILARLGFRARTG